ncbi:hypothetical protein D3C81_2268520 [compost metagenome]
MKRSMAAGFYHQLRLNNIMKEKIDLLERQVRLQNDYIGELEIAISRGDQINGRS